MAKSTTSKPQLSGAELEEALLNAGSRKHAELYLTNLSQRLDDSDVSCQLLLALLSPHRAIIDRSFPPTDQEASLKREILIRGLLRQAAEDVTVFQEPLVQYDKKSNQLTVANWFLRILVLCGLTNTQDKLLPHVWTIDISKTHIKGPWAFPDSR